jgi:hypothetical protein
MGSRRMVACGWLVGACLGMACAGSSGLPSFETASIGSSVTDPSGSATDPSGSESSADDGPSTDSHGTAPGTDPSSATASSESSPGTGDDSDSSGNGTENPNDDDDDDGVANGDDDCPAIANPDQADGDADTVGDLCDDCIAEPNLDQLDDDGDGVGNWCDTEVVDTPGAQLYVPAGASHGLGGAACYEEVRIRGTLTVPSFDGGATTGQLRLEAERIMVAAGGIVTADAAGSVGGAALAVQGGAAGSGGAAGCGGGPGSCVGQGGSGGGYGGGGGTPNDSYAQGNPCDLCSGATIAHCMGTPGGMVGSAGGDDLAMGSGGGGGGNSCGCGSGGAAGGRGGGSIALFATDRIVVDGSVRADGEQPPADASNCGYRPGGGGGSGGAIVVAAAHIEGSGMLRAHGGDGGAALGFVDDQTWGWAGGGGGGGRVKRFSPDDGFAGPSDVGGGAAGTAPATEYSADGTTGGAGSTANAAAIPPSLADITCD